MHNMKSDFLIDPGVIFLNHGSFGACPKPVFESYQYWQRELERQPLDFLGRRAIDLLASARQELADYLNVDRDDVVFFQNPTTAINMVARSLDLQPGDEILATNHEYGAMDRTWRFICDKSGAQYRQQPIPLPVTNQVEFIESFFQGVTSRTKVIFISHITSQTALIFPIKEICEKARQAGLISIVDGAHAPGQIPLDLKTLSADIYTGACHKWLCAPKGSAFLYAQREVQAWLKPLVVSWGYESEKPSPSQFIDYHEWQGTRDLAAFLAVPAAIRYQRDNDWHVVQDCCHNIASQTRAQINSITGLDAISPDSPEWFGQMFAAYLPKGLDPDHLMQQLNEQFNIEVLAHLWQEQPMIRVSFQAYNDYTHAGRLIEALQELLK